MDIEVKQLDLKVPNSLFAAFTYPRFRPFLDGTTEEFPANHDIWLRRMGFVALKGGLPVGLALGYETSKGSARLLSIFVAGTHRRLGAGDALLQTFEDQCRTRGLGRVHGSFSSGQDRSALLALTAKHGWSNPSLLEFRVAGPPGWSSSIGHSWTRLLMRVRRQGYSATPWSDISAEDRARAEELESEQDPQDVIVRFSSREEWADPAISMAIRQNGILVGYVLGETRADQHHYTAGYVAKPLQRHGWLLAGLDTVVAKQSEIYGPKSISVYETAGTNTPMVDFMRRRLAPIASWWDERYQVEKSLR